MASNLEAVDRARRHGLADLLHRSARRYPDKPALIDGDRRLTFAEFDRAVDRTAAALSARGLAHGERLALLSRNCWQFAVLAFATARIGVVLVPVNFMLNADEIAYILRHSGATAMVAEDLLETADKALEVAGSDGDIRDDPRRRGPADRLGGRRQLVDRRRDGDACRTCTWPTTTRCG